MYYLNWRELEIEHYIKPHRLCRLSNSLLKSINTGLQNTPLYWLHRFICDCTSRYYNPSLHPWSQKWVNKSAP
jgi:hypothetical protein